MKSLLLPAVLALVATPVLAQSAGQNSSFLTRELNRAPPSAATPAPATVTTRPLGQPAPTTVPPAAAAPPPAAAPAPAAPAPATSATATEPPAPPPPVALNAAAIAALPFRVDLPAGVLITAGRPGPNFNVWSIRKGDQTLAMVYAGPASQFPIYDGQLIQLAGRSSIVVTEDDRRMALEHLFQRTTAPAEIHVWVASVDGADRILAEQIAQTVDPR